MVHTKDKFIRLWEFFAWMDRARWSRDDEEYDKQIRERISKASVGVNGNELKPADIVLTHWLTCIFNYGMPAEKVRNNAFPIMAHIAYHYRKGDSCKQIIKEHIELKKSKSNVRKKNFEFHVGQKSRFRHRFGRKGRLKKRVERTLLELEAYDRNLVTFMLEKSKNSPDEKWVRDVYCALYKLTYGNARKIDDWHKRT